MRRTSEKLSKMGLIYTLLLTILFPFIHGKYLEECERSFIQNADIALTCRLRTINSEFDKTNFSAISGDSVVSLNLECSDVLFYQSSLQPGSLAHFSRLGSLHIEHCKLSRLPPDVFAGLSLLKNLTIRTHNTAWPVLSLDIAPGTFTNVPQLERVDLSSNSIWTFPDKLFCPARQLKSLNVSMNRLQELNQFGENSGCKLGLELQVLDLSYNRLIFLPPRGLSGLSSLRELYVQGNEVSVVADRALQGLENLQIINLGGNKLVALPESLFQNSKEITEIYLQNNSLSSLPPKFFTKLEKLVVLDLSHNLLTSNWMNGGISIDFSNETSTTSQPATTTAISKNGGVFSGLIRLVLLNLSYNNLTHLTPEPFVDLYSLQILRLENNKIEKIEANTFSAMNNLHTLVLSYNNLKYLDATTLNGLFVLSLVSLDNNALTDIHTMAFHNCSNLMDLNLNGNQLTKVPEGVQNLRLLKTIDLGENQIEQLESPKLIGLPNLYGLRLTSNSITHVPKDAFENLPSLKIANLAKNNISKIDPGAFDNNPNLQAVRLDSNSLTDISNLFSESQSLIFLNVSDNYLTWFDYALIPKQLQWLDIHKNSISELGNYFQATDLRLQTLDASFNRVTKIGPTNIPDSVEQLFINDCQLETVEPHTFYKNTNLSRVDLFANQIETMDFKSIQLAPFPEDKTLPEFYIAGNPLLCDCSMEWLQRLNKLDHLRQHPKVMDLDSVYCKLVYHREKLFVPLSEADPSQFLCSYKTHCFALCHCCDFDACDCQMTCPEGCECFNSDTWSENIVNCAGKGHTNVPARIPMDSTSVYLDGNNLEELTSHVFIGRKNLRVLYLNNSNIERIQNNSFSGLKRLQILHLEDNYIAELRGYELEPLESVREIYLQNNNLMYIANNTFSSLRQLEVLRLDHNKLTKFSLWVLSSNPYIVEIAIDHNPWSCDCDFVSQATPWLQSNVAKLMDTQSIMCRLHGKSSLSLVYMNGTKCSEITALSGAVEAPESSLPPYFSLLIVISSVALLIASVFVAVCRKRNSLRIWAIAKCPLKHCYQTTLDDDREKLYDVYVAYSVQDESFANELQQQFGNSYRLCLHYKDFPVSSYIADTIVEAVESSRRTVIVLSKNFIQSEWCRFEFKSALHAALRGKKNRLVAVTLGDLPTRDLDPDLRVCLRSATVLNANDKLFWHKLRCALPNPRASASSYSTRTLTRPGSGSSVASSVSNNYNYSGGGSTLPLNLSSHQYYHQNGTNGTMPHPHTHHSHSHHNNSSSVSVPMFVPPFPPPNRPPPPFPAPRRPPPPAPLWA